MDNKSKNTRGGVIHIIPILGLGLFSQGLFFLSGLVKGTIWRIIKEYWFVLIVLKLSVLIRLGNQSHIFGVGKKIFCFLERGKLWQSSM